MAEQTREQIGKPVEESMMSRAKALVGFVINGKVPTQWMGAGTALPPVAQESEGRKTDYSMYRNTQTSPKASEGITFAMLRALADAYDPLRLIIESRKDQIAGQTWTIKPRDESKKEDERTKALVNLFSRPDGQHDWADWLRLISEDLLVLDSVAIYPRKAISGATYAFEVVDAATIKRVVDDSGRTPPAPATAYQQILKGVPASDYSVDELLYRSRNIRTNRFYGYSPVEQIITTVQTGLNRQLSQLQYFTEGTVPDAMAGVPESWTSSQIKEWQGYWDDLMQGDTSKKRTIRFLAKDMADSYKETKAPPLKDMFDEWIMRIVCYAFSIDPTPFIAQVNRSVAETTREQALEEGLVPLMNWIKNLINQLLTQYCDAADLEFCWEEEDSINPMEQASILKLYVDGGIISVDEARAKIGYDPADVEGDDGTGTGKDVQQTALNGTQISSLLSIVSEATSKNLPIDTAKAIMRAAFPTTPEDLISAIFDPVANFEKPPPPAPMGLDGKPLPVAPVDENGKPMQAPTKKPTAAEASKDLAEKVEVHIHNNVSVPDVFVDVGATNITANLQTPTTKITKTVTAARNSSGELIAKIIEEPSDE